MVESPHPNYVATIESHQRSSSACPPSLSCGTTTTVGAAAHAAAAAAVDYTIPSSSDGYSNGIQSYNPRLSVLTAAAAEEASAASAASAASIRGTVFPRESGGVTIRRNPLSDEESRREG